jgi:hypothetical protein
MHEVLWQVAPTVVSTYIRKAARQKLNITWYTRGFTLTNWQTQSSVITGLWDTQGNSQTRMSGWHLVYTKKKLCLYRSIMLCRAFRNLALERSDNIRKFYSFFRKLLGNFQQCFWCRDNIHYRAIVKHWTSKLLKSEKFYLLGRFAAYSRRNSLSFRRNVLAPPSGSNNKPNK